MVLCKEATLTRADTSPPAKTLTLASSLHARQQETDCVQPLVLATNGPGRAWGFDDASLPRHQNSASATEARD